MIVKTRKKSGELQILASLNNRMELPDKYKSRFFTLQKGYEGEVLFESYIGRLQNNYLILNDLFLQENSNSFQLDSVMITEEKILLYEVKNYEGDYYYDSEKDRIYSKTKEILNPYSQAVKAETLLRQLLLNHGVKFPIDFYVVFVNPEFTLYNAPLDKPFIYPTQINRFLKRFDKPMNKPNKNRYIADKLLSLHTSDAQFWQIPDYDYEALRKGIPCANCSSFLIFVEGQSCVCNECGHRESVSSAVLRCVQDFQLLFPSEKITTSRIFDWVEGVLSSRTILRLLEHNFTKIGRTRSAYFK